MNTREISTQLINNDNRAYYSSEYKYTENVMIRVSNHLPKYRYLIPFLESNPEIDVVFIIISTSDHIGHKFDDDSIGESMQETLTDSLERDITVEVIKVGDALELLYAKSRIELYTMKNK